MVTWREIVPGMARLVVTFITAIYVFCMALFLLLRLGTGEHFWFIAMLNNFAPYCFVPVIGLAVLALTTRSKWALLASLPLLLIGGITYRDYFVAKASTAPSGPTLHIVTFNFYSSNTSLERIQSWLREQNADLVFIQEVPQEAVQPFIYRMSTQYAYSSNRTGAEGASSNILFSHYPILSIEDLQQPSETHTRQRYVIGQPGSEIAVYNVDVALPVTTPRLLMDGEMLNYVTGYDADDRDANLQRLLNRIHQESLPYIVAGDFSMTDQTNIYQAFASIMYDSYREAGIGIGATWPVNSVEQMLPQFVPPIFRVDYIWHSDHFRAVNAELGSPLDSDHLPLVVTLETRSS